MGWEHVLAFNVTLLAAMAVPGPAFLYALRQSVSGGLRTGIATGAGLATVAALWTGAALLGLHAVFTIVPWLYLALKVAGAAYLVAMAISMWKNARQPVADTAAPGARAYLGGVLVNLANPKAVLFSGAVLIVIFPPGLSLFEKSAIAVNQFAVELTVYSIFAMTLAKGPARAGYLRLKPVIDRIAAGLLGALGLRIALT